MGDKGFDGIKGDHPGVPVVLPIKARRDLPLTEQHKATAGRWASTGW